MKLLILLLCLVTGNIMGMDVADSPPPEVGGPNTSLDQSAATEGSPLDTAVLQQKLGEVAKDSGESPDGTVESMDAPVEVPSLNTIPASIFFKDRGYIEGAAVATSYYAKSAFTYAGNVLTTVSSLSPSGVVKKLGESAGDVSKSMTVEECPRFPNLSVKYICKVFEGVENRKGFVEKGIFERCVLFERGGYLGAAIILDYNVGQDRRFESGNRLKDFLSVDDTTRVDQAIIPCAWMKSQFNIESCTLNFMMEGSRFKDAHYNSHLLYKIGGDPEAFYLDVMRKPGVEFVKKIAAWIYAQKEFQDAQKTALEGVFMGWINGQTSITSDQQELLCKHFREAVAELKKFPK